MLLKFEVGGYLSFNEIQEIYFVPETGARLKRTRYEDNFHLKSEFREMKSSIIFGENASGKTNCIIAIDRFTKIIKNGLQEIKISDFNNNAEIVHFGIVVSNGKSYFEYDLEYNKEGLVKREELKKNGNIVFDFKDDKLVMGSKMNKNSKEDKIRFDMLEIIFSEKSTNTMLFKLKDSISEEISEFIQIVDKIKVKYDFFINESAKYINISIYNKEEIQFLDENKKEVMMIFNSLDRTITGFEFKEREMLSDESGFEMYIIRNCDKQDNTYSLANESKGIKKIAYLLNSILKISLGETLIIDELDSSISTQALIKLYNCFINSSNNKKGQLIVSSNNPNLLNLSMFHSSQLNIISKSRYLESFITPIQDYDIRSDKKNLGSDYIRGKFNHK